MKVGNVRAQRNSAAPNGTAGVSATAAAKAMGVSRRSVQRAKKVMKGDPETHEAAVLALDPGLSLGWALRTPDGHVTHGTLDLRSRRFEGGGMRYLRFRRWLTEMKTCAGELEAIYFEEVRAHRGVDAAHVYGGLVATLTAWCEHHGIPYAGVPVGTWKRDLTGKGNADKAAVMAAVQNLGYAPETQDEADALGVLHHGNG